jgi:hypothetical protein
MRITLKAHHSQAIEAPLSVNTRDIPLVSSRRSFVRLLGLMVIAAMPAWVSGTRPPQKIIVIDGWILADTDLR